MNNPVQEHSILFDFTAKQSETAWTVINDGVMGGLSKGYFELKPGCALFKGKVSTDNNGGFTMVRKQFDKKPAGGFSAFLLKVKGDGRRYQFRVKAELTEMHSYVKTFKTDKNWQEITIPFSGMLPRFRGRSLDMPPYEGSSVAEVAFLIGNKKDEAFELMIESIAMV